ncbi:aquaporin-10-like protein 2, partial [Leptotrombidium deliense]
EFNSFYQKLSISIFLRLHNNYYFNHYLGGHINPAVTFAFAAFKKFPWRKVWYYILAQYLGGFAAAAVVYVTYAEAITSFDEGQRSAFGNENSTGGIFATYPAPYATIFGVFIDQVIGTSILIIAVMAITDDKNIKTPKGIQPLAIGFMIAGVCTAYCLNAGAIFNPARDVPPRLLTAIAGWGLEPFKPLGGHYWWVAGIVGPHIGAMVGIIVYTITIDHQSLCIETRSVVPKENSEVEHHAEKNGSGKSKCCCLIAL